MNTQTGAFNGAAILGIVTISKNDVSGLTRTLQSARSLRSKFDVQQIVVDGGGSDAGRLCTDHGCTHVVQTGSGIGPAFNQGWKRACSDWVWFLNGGDTVHPQLQLEPLLGILSASRSDVVVCGVVYENELGWQRPRGYLEGAFPFSCWIAHPGALIRKSLLARLDGFDDSYAIAADFDFWLRAAQANATFDSISIPIACFDATGVSQSAASRPRLVRENRVILRKHRNLFVRRWGWATRRLLRLILNVDPHGS